jgi:signal transduction histidine kinase
VLRDVSAEHVLQRQLHHAQKLDAVGKLAGGIAHDFNNLLAGVVGACELLAVRLPEGDPDRRWVDLIDGAAARAAELTRKLLAFGRRTPDQALPVELGSVVRQVAGLLERTLERSIALQVEEPRSPLWLRGDPSQLQSALLNLCLNARDAMPGGGTLRLSLADAAPAPPGDAVLLGQMPDGCRAMLSVTDTGHGIEEHLLERIFEPVGLRRRQGARRRDRGALQAWGRSPFRPLPAARSDAGRLGGASVGFDDPGRRAPPAHPGGR